MTATPWPGPQRHEFSTTDPELAREFLHQTFGSRLLVRSSSDAFTRVAVTVTDAGPFTVSDVTLPGDLTFGTTGSDTVAVGTLVAGTIQDDQGKDTDRYQPGDVLLGSWPQAGYTSRTHRIRTHGVTLPASLLYTVAGRAPSAPLRFVSLARSSWMVPAITVSMETVSEPVVPKVRSPGSVTSLTVKGPASVRVAASRVMPSRTLLTSTWMP